MWVLRLWMLWNAVEYCALWMLWMLWVPFRHFVEKCCGVLRLWMLGDAACCGIMCCDCIAVVASCIDTCGCCGMLCVI